MACCGCWMLQTDIQGIFPTLIRVLDVILYLLRKRNSLKSEVLCAIAPQTGVCACCIGVLPHDGVRNVVEPGGIQRSSHSLPHIPRPANFPAKFLWEICDHIEYYFRDRVRTVVNNLYKFERPAYHPLYLFLPASKNFHCKSLGNSNSKRAVQSNERRCCEVIRQDSLQSFADRFPIGGFL